jgi:hypothetical protein
MRRIFATIAGLAIATAAQAQVDTTRPMLTGHGNVEARPNKAIVTNQTAVNPNDQAVTLEKFVVTGSLIHHPKGWAHRKQPHI